MSQRLLRRRRRRLPALEREQLTNRPLVLRQRRPLLLRRLLAMTQLLLRRRELRRELERFFCATMRPSESRHTLRRCPPRTTCILHVILPLARLRLCEIERFFGFLRLPLMPEIASGVPTLTTRPRARAKPCVTSCTYVLGETTCSPRRTRRGCGASVDCTIGARCTAPSPSNGYGRGRGRSDTRRSGSAWYPVFARAIHVTFTMESMRECAARSTLRARLLLAGVARECKTDRCEQTDADDRTPCFQGTFGLCYRGHTRITATTRRRLTITTATPG